MRPFLPFAIRDVLFLSITLGLVWLDASLADRGVLGLAIGVTAGLFVPYAGFLAHEWGHLAGTLLSGGRAHAPSSLVTFFLFFFDVETSTRRQFLAMSYGGYLATLGVVALLALWIDVSRLSGVIALVLSVIGIGVTFARELPTTWSVARGGPLPTGGVYRGTPTA
ncbi:MAG: hypothetical protein J0L92_16875 [Deltaproteobacteria bacterium]|nr:hypothetical protein [Deltaproteobacteria bacterium]